MGTWDKFQAGPGTYTRGGYIYASVVGVQEVLNAQEQPGHAVMQVLGRAGAPVVPEPGSIVISKVTKVSPTSASAKIVCCGTQALEADFTGIIRQQDVRAHEIDKVMAHLGKGGGFVDVQFAVSRFHGHLMYSPCRARVLSLGDARSYYLTTADNTLGVVHAKSLAGVAMVPISWQEMQDPKTLIKEKRKVAKVES
eukprot:gene3225-3502_t